MSRLKLIEVKRFIKTVRKSKSISKDKRKKCWNMIFKNTLISAWNKISAPLIYPIWYLFRKLITKKIYKGTSWQDIKILMEQNKTDIIEKKLIKNGKFLYWLWTYGDSKDPLGWGGMPKDFKSGKNTFWNRYCYSALRNPRFTYNYMYFRTGEITNAITEIDTRDFNYMHKSYGIGDSPDGIYFKWLKDNNDKWYFIYEDNNVNNIFYFGYVGFLKKDIGEKGGRFEIGYRKTDSSYEIK